MREDAPALRLAVIGAGRAGRQFAFACLAAGQRVVLEDVLPGKLRGATEEFERQEALWDASQLTLATSVEEAVREADVAIDFVPDELESKLEIFSLMDRMAPPRTILVTPTEALSIADLASCTYREGRCFGLRGLAAALAPANEVEASSGVTLAYPAAGADAAALDAVARLLGRLGLAHTLVQDEMPSMLAGH